MFKNLLWFAREPADEREALILSAAYRRAMTVLWIGLVATLFYATVAHPFGTVSFATLGLAVELLVALSIIAGQKMLAGEDLEFKPVRVEKRPAMSVPVIATFALLAAAMLATWISPKLLFVAMAAVVLGSYSAFAATAWVWTKPYTMHGRVLGVVLTPISVLAWLRYDKIATWKRVMLAVIIPSVIASAVATISAAFFSFVAIPSGYDGAVSPGYETAAFRRTILDPRQVGGLKNGDLASFVIGLEPFYGTVRSANGADVCMTAFRKGTLETEDVCVNADAGISRVIVDPPFSSIADQFIPPGFLE